MGDSADIPDEKINTITLKEHAKRWSRSTISTIAPLNISKHPSTASNDSKRKKQQQQQQRNDALVDRYAWLWEESTLRSLCETLEGFASNQENMYEQIDGREYLSLNLGDSEDSKEKLRLLRREAYDELWQVLDELNLRANRRNRTSPVQKTNTIPDQFDGSNVGWYKNRNYMIMGNPGSGKTAFLIMTLVQRILEKKPTIVQTGTTPRRAFLFDEFTVTTLDLNSKVKDEIDSYYKMNRSLWVLFDSTPMSVLLNPNWIKIQTSRTDNVSYSSVIDTVQQSHYIRNFHPVRLYMNLWSFNEVLFISSHLLKYNHEQLRRGMVFYQYYDPTARITFCSKLIKDDAKYHAYMNKLQAWLPQEIQQQLTNGYDPDRRRDSDAEIVSMVKQSQSSNIPCQLVIQRPDVSEEFPWVGVSATYQVATAYISDTIVETAFEMNQSASIEKWMGDLATQHTYANVTSEALVVSLVNRKLRAGGKFALVHKSLNAGTIRLRPSTVVVEEDEELFGKVSEFVSSAQPDRCNTGAMDRYMTIPHGLNMAILNEKSGPRLVVFVASNDKTSVYAEDLHHLWQTMPEECKRKTPYLANVQIDTSQDSPLMQPQHPPLSSSNSRTSITSLDDDAETLAKVMTMFEEFSLVISRDELFADSYSSCLGMRLRLFYRRLLRRICAFFIFFFSFLFR